MSTVLEDIRYAIRRLCKAPSFSAIALATLALGIGVNAAIFSVLNTVILKPLPYEDAERLMFVMESRPNTPFISVAYLNYLDWREQNESFEQMAIVRGQTYNLTGDHGPVRLMGAQVSANFFATLGAQPMLGRTFEPLDDHPGAARTAVLNYGVWQRRFGGDPSILGKTLVLNGTSYTVVGVLPADFKWLLQHQPPEVWTPIGLWADTDMLSRRGNRSGMNVIARLEDDVRVKDAEADLATIAQRLEDQYPATNTGSRVRMMPFQERIVGGARTPLLILLGAVGLVLMIACANVANLLLARATGRTMEMAVRTAVGARRLRLIRQLLTESSVLAVTGGIIGVWLAYLGIDLLVAASPADLPRIDEVGIDGTVLAFSAMLALLTAGVFGLAPALQSSRPDLSATLKGSVGGPARGKRFRNGLVVAEVALALVLLISAGLLIRSFWRLQTESPGFNSENVWTGQIVLTGPSYPDQDANRAFYYRLLEKLHSVPGVQAAGIINPLPVTNTGWQARFMIEGQPRPEPGEFPFAEWMQISPGYFHAMEIPLLRGRVFTDYDRLDTQQVVIIDENFANRHFPNQDPTGRRIAFGESDSPTWREIVGVVGHVKLNGVAEEAGIEMYTPYAQSAYAPITLILRSTGDPGSVASAVRNTVRAIDPDVPVYNIRMMDELLDKTVEERGLAMKLLTIFAILALVLVAVGIYGVMSYTVSQRTREIGVRVALGAQQTNVLSLVIRHGATLALTGLAIGIVAAYGVTRLLRSMLFGVEPTDPITFGLVSVFLAVVALAACVVPARRASRADPLVALRYE